MYIIYIYVSMYILYIAPTKRRVAHSVRGSKHSSFPSVANFEYVCQNGCYYTHLIEFHSMCLPIVWHPKNQTSTSPRVSKQLNPPPGIFGFFLFGTPVQVISNSQGRGLRGRCWGGCPGMEVDGSMVRINGLFHLFIHKWGILGF